MTTKHVLLSALLIGAGLAGCLTGPSVDDDGTGADGAEPGQANMPFDRDVDRPVDEALAATGRWLDPIIVEEPPVHATLTADARLLVWGVAHDHQETGAPILAPFSNAESRVYDLSTSPVGTFTPSPSDGGATDLFCSDQSLLVDGRVIAFGGTRWAPAPDNVLYGTEDVRAWDPETNAWTQLEPMAHGRWYPSSLVLADGRVLVAGGYTVPGDPSTNVEALEVFDPANDAMTELPTSADRDLPMYPRLYTVPSGPLKGDVFYQPAGCLWCPFGNSDEEIAWNMAASFDPETNTWTDHGVPVAGVRNAPVTALLPLRPPTYEARLLTASGTLARSGFGTTLAEITDLSVEPPTHTLTEPMQEGRWFPSHVVLPDGNLFVFGGARQDGVLALGSDANPVTPVLEAELFVPNDDGLTGTWQELAPMTIPRVYHSTALLLPDGRVMAAGSVPNQVENPVTDATREKGIEIFEPPYLFRGPRPVIETAPAHVTWGERFVVGTPDAATISEVVLVRAGTTTHVYNPEQRLIELVVTGASDDALTVEAPPDGALAPPGHYMLFLMKETERGPVPSVAAMVQVS